MGKNAKLEHCNTVGMTTGPLSTATGTTVPACRHFILPMQFESWLMKVRIHSTQMITVTTLKLRALEISATDHPQWNISLSHLKDNHFSSLYTAVIISLNTKISYHTHVKTICTHTCAHICWACTDNIYVCTFSVHVQYSMHHRYMHRGERWGVLDSR